MKSEKWTYSAMPKSDNMEVISCKCGLETIVLQKDYVNEYICSNCWKYKIR